MSIKMTDILTGTNAQKILWFMLDHPGEEFYDREICGLTDISRAGTNVALRELASANFLTRINRGRMAYYSLNFEHALIRQLKVVRVLAQLEEFLVHIREQSMRIVLFGSGATGNDASESDWDLFVLTRNPSEIRKQLSKSSLEERIQLVVHTPTEWTRIRKQNRVFADEVEKGLGLWDEMSEKNLT
jgi:predicted nucleotidyltransferase